MMQKVAGTNCLVVMKVGMGSYLTCWCNLCD